jgi:hypothetical protein
MWKYGLMAHQIWVCEDGYAGASVSYCIGTSTTNWESVTCDFKYFGSRPIPINSGLSSISDLLLWISPWDYCRKRLSLVDGSKLRSDSDNSPRSKEKKKTNPKAAKVFITQPINRPRPQVWKRDWFYYAQVYYTLRHWLRHQRKEHRPNAGKLPACSLNFVLQR